METVDTRSEESGSVPRVTRWPKTLKQETARPGAATLRGQQRPLNRFIQEFNTLRPHEALDQETPASKYTSSPRPYPSRHPTVEYPDHFEKCLVSRNGEFRWLNRRVPISHTLQEQYVGLEEVDDWKWEVNFGIVRLGQMDERTFRIEDALGNRMRRRV